MANGRPDLEPYCEKCGKVMLIDKEEPNGILFVCPCQPKEGVYISFAEPLDWRDIDD